MIGFALYRGSASGVKASASLRLTTRWPLSTYRRDRPIAPRRT